VHWDSVTLHCLFKLGQCYLALLCLDWDRVTLHWCVYIWTVLPCTAVFIFGQCYLALLCLYWDSVTLHCCVYIGTVLPCTAVFILGQCYLALLFKLGQCYLALLCLNWDSVTLHCCVYIGTVLPCTAVFIFGQCYLVLLCLNSLYLLSLPHLQFNSQHNTLWNGCFRQHIYWTRISNLQHFSQPFSYAYERCAWRSTIGGTQSITNCTNLPLNFQQAFQC